MVEKLIRLSGDVVDFARLQSDRNAAGKLAALPTRICRHCGAALLDGESEDDCSSAAIPDGADLRCQPYKLCAD